MAGRTASQAITRYAGIQVQTSSLGVNIPVGWGTFRTKCNLLDYLDFSSKAQHASGGKGGGSVTTGYSYAATVILGLCEGPIDAIRQVYVDSQVYTNGAKTALQKANLNASLGAIGQPVWSYLTSNHPAHAIGYSGLAIAYQSHYALDGAAAPPNHSFEVVRTTGFGPVTTPSGGEDVDPSLVIADFLQNSRTGVPSWPASGLLGDMSLYQDYCLAAGLLLSPLIDAQRSASDFLNEVLLATNSTCVWSEGVLKFIPYGDTAVSGNGHAYMPNNTPVYSLTDDDFIQDRSGDPVLQVDIEDQSDAYNVVQLEYLDRTNQYNMAIALASDAANVAQFGLRRKDPTTTHVICDPTVAALAAQLHLQRTLYIRAQYKFKLGWVFALLEPGDIIELTDAGLGLEHYPVRITQIDEDEKYGLSIVCEDYPVGVSHSPLYQMQTGVGADSVVDQGVDPGGVEANLFLWSDDRTQSGVYAYLNATIGRGAAHDQYGQSTADAIIPTSGVSGPFVVSQAVAATNFFANCPYTFSVCLQAGAHAKAIVRIGDGQGDGIGLNIDLAAGQIVSTFNDGANPGNVVRIASSIVPTLASGVWQVLLTVEMASVVAGTNVLNCQVYVLDNAFNETWTGDGSNAIYTSQWQVRQGVAIGTYAATSGAIAGPIILAPPAALATGSAMYAAAAGGPNWGGAYVWASIDGTNYEEIGQIGAPARFGRLTTAFASHADPDTADTLAVDLGWSGGALAGASSTQAVDQGATTAWLGPAGELIAYETATLTNPCRYSLGGYIRRGFMNTPIAGHNSGDQFVRLDDAVFEFPYLDINTGQTVYIKFQSYNAFGRSVVDLANCIAYSIVPNPATANAPAAGVWTATASTIASGADVLPVLEVAGAVDNPSATSIQLYYRPTGAASWQSAGAHPASTREAFISPVAGGATYDVAITYIVGGVETAKTQIGSGLTVAMGNLAGTVYYQSTSPASPKANDIWVDTGASPNTVSVYVGGAWCAAATNVTGTSQLVDTANLGQTAVWSTVSAKPANVGVLGGSEDIQNSILQSALTAGSVVPATFAGQGALATLNQTDTPQIVVGSVTETYFALNGSGMTGAGVTSYAAAISYSVTLTYAADLILIAPCQVTFSSGNWALRIVINDGTSDNILTSQTENIDHFCTLASAISLSPGTYTVRVDFAGSGSGVTMNPGGSGLLTMRASA